MKTSGIGGQAVIEGIMMRNKDKYSIAIRKANGEIETTIKDAPLLTTKYKWLNKPIIRGVFNFIDSLRYGLSTITYSTSFYDDPEEVAQTKGDEAGKALFRDKYESILMAVTIIFSVFLAIGLFMLLPFFISRALVNVIANQAFLNFIEGIVRLIIFLLYMIAISKMKDIKRTFMYHGAEHKCINCIESGVPLTVENVMNSSRFHKRCGTSFLFIVMFVSIVLYIFINFSNTGLQILVRILLIPVVAGISYELIQLAGKKDNLFSRIFSAPGMWMQHFSTREPDESMVEVAIAAVEEVFDWAAFLENYYKDEDNVEQIIEHKENELAVSASVNTDTDSRTIKTEEVVAATTDEELTTEEKYLKNAEIDMTAKEGSLELDVLEDEESHEKYSEKIATAEESDVEKVNEAAKIAVKKAIENLHEELAAGDSADSDVTVDTEDDTKSDDSLKNDDNASDSEDSTDDVDSATDTDSGNDDKGIGEDSDNESAEEIKKVDFTNMSAKDIANTQGLDLKAVEKYLKSSEESEENASHDDADSIGSFEDITEDVKDAVITDDLPVFKNRKTDSSSNANKKKKKSKKKNRK